MRNNAPVAPHTLCVGLADWRARLHVDTEAGFAQIAPQCAPWEMPDTGTPMTLLSVHLAGGSAPRLHLTRDEKPLDISPIFDGPGGKSFSPVPHPSRRLYQDLAMGGDEPVVEICGDDLVILRPDVWTFYVMHVLNWLMVCEAPVVGLHAAVCAVDGVGLVILGPSGCGKSTLSWALAEQGADYFSDERAFIDMTHHHLHVRTHSACLRPGGIAVLEAPPEVTSWRRVKPNDPKFVADLPVPQAACPAQFVLLFVSGFADEPKLAPIRGGEAACRVTRLMAAGDPSPAVRMEMAADIVSRAPCRALTIGRPRETAEMLIAYARTVRAKK